MQISVVIPTHNRAALVGRAVASVLAQRPAPAEVIVVDDGSTDGTAAALARYDGRIRLLRQPNAGVAAARNAGIRAAAGDWIALLDSDDCWLPGKLARQMAYHRDAPDALVSQTDERWLRQGRPVSKAKGFRQKKEGWIFAASLLRCEVSPSAVLIHRQVFDRAGLFDEGLPACEDYDLWLRIARRWPVGLVDEPLIEKHGGHADQLSRRYWGMDRFRIRAMEKHLDDHPWRSAVLEELVRRCAIVAAGAAKRGNEPVRQCYDRKQHLYREMLAAADQRGRTSSMP